MISRRTNKALYVWLITVLALSIYPIKGAIKVQHSDLVAHFILYAVTGALFYIAFRESRFGLLNRSPAVLAILLASLYGFGMEVAQYYVPRRNFSISDSLANTLGAVIAVSLLVWRKQGKPQEQDGAEGSQKEIV
jgi:VanZ family protein